MSTPIQIDIISDVMCPWCVIGYASLNKALQSLPEVSARVQWHPFELNPQMADEGQNLREHLAEKYGSTPEQSREIRERITSMGADLGFEFNFSDEQRIFNTFDAHQLLSWAGELSQNPDWPDDLQTQLKLALFTAYFRDGRDVSDRQQLLEIAAEVGLDQQQSNDILQQQHFASEVRAEQQQWQQMGIQSVPAVVLNNKYLVSGGQPVDVFIEALRKVVSENDAPVA